MQTNLLFPTLALLAAVALGPAETRAEMRQWTNAEGTRHIDAEFVEFTEGKVALRMPDGAIVRMPLEALSVRDRNFIRDIGKTKDMGPVKPMEPIKSTKKKLVGGTAIRKVLGRRLKLSYQDVPLGEMLGDLKERIGVEIVVDGNSLAEASVPFDTPISMSTTGFNVGTALQSALNKIGAAWTIRHEVLMVVAKTQEDGLVPVVYKIIQPVPSRTLTTDIIRSVAVPRWLETGGQGRMERLNRVLVISQTSEVHAEIADRYQKVLKPVVLSAGGASATVLRGLRQRTQLELKAVPLSKVLDHLAKKHNLKFTMDHVAIAQKGIDADSPVTIQVSGVMVESALGIMLDSLKLVARVDKGTVRITTKRNNISEEDLISKTYDLRPLSRLAKTSAIRDVLEDLVARDTWEDHGGQGDIDRSKNSRYSIIVRQTPAVHAQIRRVLSELVLAQ